MDEPIEDESGRYLARLATDGLPARSVGSWAKKKLQVLKTYIDLFTVGMKPTSKKEFNWSNLVYIDLFSGPGRCIIRTTGEEILGSPLHAFNAPYPFSKLYFIEASEWARQTLSERVGKDKRCIVLEGNCNIGVSRIVQEKIDNSLYLAFIDPTGLDIHFQTIKNLANGIPCDLIVNFFMSSLTRNLPHWQQQQESERLDLFFGTSEWKALLTKPQSQNRIFRDMVDLYRRQLEGIGYIHQADPYSVKNSKGAEMYWLWFASKHPLGLKYWKETIKSSDQQGTLF